MSKAKELITRGATPLVLLSALMGPAVAQAQAAPTLSGSVSIVSDYRFRGVSYSDLGPAVQAGLNLATAPGFFANVWGTNIADFNGAHMEVDLTAGWQGRLGDFNASGGAILYTYPGGADTTEYESFASLGLPLGPATATVGLNWAPPQRNLRSSNRYVFGELSFAIPGRPITLKASLGHERGGLVVDETAQRTDKWNWQVGADAHWKAFTLGIAWVGNDLPRAAVGGIRPNRTARDTLLASLSASF